jgi:hypothetical protein
MGWGQTLLQFKYASKPYYMPFLTLGVRTGKRKTNDKKASFPNMDETGFRTDTRLMGLRYRNYPNFIFLGHFH